MNGKGGKGKGDVGMKVMDGLTRMMVSAGGRKTGGNEGS